MSVASPASNGWLHDASRCAAASSAASRGALWPSISAGAAAGAAASRDNDAFERGYGLLDAAAGSLCAVARSSHSSAQNGQVQCARADCASIGDGRAAALIDPASPQGT